MKTLTLLIALIILIPGGTRAADQTIELSQAMDRAGFSTTQAAQVQSIIKTASRSGVPADAVRSKVYEGMAKQIAPDRIITAMERVTSRYEYSYSLAQQLTPNNKQAARLGSTLTDGIAAGLTRQDAERLVTSLQTRAEQMDSKRLYQLAEESMRTARDMSRQGVSSATTADVIGKAVQQGYGARDMQAMRSTFSKQAAQSNRESLARDYGTAIDRGVQARDLSGIGTGGRGRSSGANAGDGTSGENSNDAGNSGGAEGSNGSAGGSSGNGSSDGAGSSGGSNGAGGSEGGSSGNGGNDGSGGAGGGGNGGGRR